MITTSKESNRIKKDLILLNKVVTFILLIYVGVLTNTQSYHMTIYC